MIPAPVNPEKDTLWSLVVVGAVKRGLDGFFTGESLVPPAPVDVRSERLGYLRNEIMAV